jgi:ABC-type glycerol-3-phosphate transport system substrate-binding protein
VLQRVVPVAVLGALAAARCAGAPAPAAAIQRLTLAAPATADRAARVAAWNRQFAAAQRFEVALAGLPVAAGAAAPSPEQVARLLAPGLPAPHLLWLDLGDVPALARLGHLRPLGDLAARSRYDLKRFMPVALQPAYGFDEQLYALPEEVEARQVYFNRRHFEEAAIDYRRAGFDFEAPLMTWEALRRADLDLAAAPRASQRLAFHPGHEGAPLELWFWQQGATALARGGRQATFAGPLQVEALAWLVAHARELGGPARLAAAGSFPPPARTGGPADDPDHHPFLAGRVSICFESTRFVSTVAVASPDFPLGWVEPPRRRPGAPLVSWSRAWGYALASGAPDGAWAPLAFLISEEAALSGAAAAAPADQGAGEAGRNSATATVRWFPAFTGQLAVDLHLAARYRTGIKGLDDARDHGLQQLRHAHFRRPCPAPPAVWDLLAAARRRAIGGEASAAEALSDAEREAQARLDAAWAAR